jgi:S1-C subfamily serine protease
MASSPRSLWAVPGVIAALLLLLGMGCMVAVRPSDGDRDDSYVGLAAEFHTYWGPSVDATCIVLSASEPIEFAPEATNDGRHTFAHHVPKDAVHGLGVAIGRDGYLLTAAHLINRHIYVLGLIDGHHDMKVARVVCSEQIRAGAEMAILRIDGTFDSALELKRPDHPRFVFAIGSSRRASMYRIKLAGHVTDLGAATASDAGVSIGSDMPTWHGDSGGPVLSPEGDLIGITIGVEAHTEGLKIVGNHLTWSPNPQHVAELIARDRAANPGPTAASAK